MTAPGSEPELHAYLIAGEPSGDVIGARLIEALRAEGPVRLSGVGGAEMEKAGLRSLFPYGELAIMGFTEVLPSVPRILQRMRQVATDIETARPDIIVTIDSPGFVFGVIRRLKSRTCPRVHYVAPTIWAWRAGRVKKFRKHFDHLLALFPFEPPLFEAAGLDCTFVGHPAAEGDVMSGDGPAFRERHGIDSDETVLCLLPGSRRGEISRLGPVAEAVVVRLLRERPELRIVVPAAPNVRDDIERLAARIGNGILVVDGAAERYDAFAAANLALAASGDRHARTGLCRRADGRDVQGRPPDRGDRAPDDPRGICFHREYRGRSGNLPRVSSDVLQAEVYRRDAGRIAVRPGAGRRNRRPSRRDCPRCLGRGRKASARAATAIRSIVAASRND